jgi:hypothetical protein
MAILKARNEIPGVQLRFVCIICATLLSCSAAGQRKDFRIRTITAGIQLESLEDTVTVTNAIAFLESAKKEFTSRGYEVQTLRISTQHIFEFLGTTSHRRAIPYLKKIDQIATRNGIVVSVGAILPPNKYNAEIASWAASVIEETENISFSILISSQQNGIHAASIKAAAEITKAIAERSARGEGNFRFTASANCPAGIPFFPAAFHSGVKSFAIGLESPNLLKTVFSHSDMSNARENLTMAMENALTPVEQIAQTISATWGWQYDGIDTSPAPGLDASIGEAIESLTRQPFGSPSTLSACALITGVLKNLKVKTCGYSGLMLPIIEDKTLARRAGENRFTLQELLLYSAVSGTGLDVVPLPGDTSLDLLERIYYDVASLSIKYNNKAISARLFLLPGKKAGDVVSFDNPYLTEATVMQAE